MSFFLMKLFFIHAADITYALGDQNTHMLPLNMNETAPKVNDWCGLKHDKVTGPFYFFFAGSSILAIVFLAMLEHYAAS